MFAEAGSNTAVVDPFSTVGGKRGLSGHVNGEGGGGRRQPASKKPAKGKNVVKGTPGIAQFMKRPGSDSGEEEKN
jgi:hypothetical protein